MPLFASISDILASLSPRRQPADRRQQTSLRNRSRYSSRTPSPTPEIPARRTSSARNLLSSGSALVIDLDRDDGHLGRSPEPVLGWDTITAPAQTTKSYASREAPSSNGIATTFGKLRSPSSAVDSSVHSGDVSQMLNQNSKKKDAQAHEDEARLLGGTRRYKDANAVKIQPGGSVQGKKKVPGANAAFRPTDRITRNPRDSQQSRAQVKRGQPSLAGRRQSRLGGRSELEGAKKGRRQPGNEVNDSELKPRAVEEKSNFSSPPRTSPSFFPKSSSVFAPSPSTKKTKPTETMKTSATTKRSWDPARDRPSPPPLDEEFTVRAAQERRARTAAGAARGISPSGESSDELQGDVTTRGGGGYIPTHLRQKRALTGEGAAGPARKKGKKGHDESQDESAVCLTQPPAHAEACQKPEEVTSPCRLRSDSEHTDFSGSKGKKQRASGSVSHSSPVAQLSRGGATKQVKLATSLSGPEVIDLESIRIPSVKARGSDTAATKLARASPQKVQRKSPQPSVRETNELDQKVLGSEKAVVVEVPSARHAAKAKRNSPQPPVRETVELAPKLMPKSKTRTTDSAIGQAESTPKTAGEEKIEQLAPKQAHQSDPAVATLGRKRRSSEPEQDVRIRKPDESQSPPNPKRRKSLDFEPELEAESQPEPEPSDLSDLKSLPATPEGEERKAVEPDVRISRLPESKSRPISKRKSDELGPDDELEPDVHVRNQKKSESPPGPKRRKSKESAPEDELESEIPQIEVPHTDMSYFGSPPAIPMGEKRSSFEPDVHIRSQKKSDSPPDPKRQKIKESAPGDASIKDSSLQEVSNKDAFERRATRSTTRNTQTDAHSTSLKDKGKNKAAEEDPNREKWEEPLVYPKTGKKRAEVNVEDRDRLREDQFLNDNLIAFYLRFLEEHIHRTNEKLARRIYFCNSYLYEKLTTNVPKDDVINYDAVAKWTRNINLFEYDYIVVPINEDQHWYLSIIYNLPTLNIPPGTMQTKERPVEEHPEEVLEILKAAKAASTSVASLSPSAKTKMDGLEWTDPNAVQPDTSRRSLRSRSNLPGTNKQPQSDSDTPGPPPGKKSRGRAFILTFDSLGLKRSQSNNILRRYIMAEAENKFSYEIERKSITGRSVVGIPLQKNYSDCGLYLLAYVEKFLQNPVAFMDKVEAKRLKLNDWPTLKANGLRARFRDFLDNLYDEQFNHVRDPQRPLMVDETPVSFLLPPRGPQEMTQ